MRHVFGTIVAIAAVGAWCALAAAQQLEFDPQTMMRATEVERGMRGTGRSVFRGVEVEEFGFEVVGRFEKAIAGRDMVLAQLVSGPPTERNAGVIGGMSGSPCYINGRLLGALAYGWYWQKEALFGITPIEDMLEATMPLAQAQARPGGGAWLASAPIRLGGREVRSAVLSTAANPSAFAAADTIALQPLRAPVTCAGMGPNAMAAMRTLLEPHGLEPLAGPGTKSDPIDVTIEPGSAVGVRLMEGDFEATAVGTATYTAGDQVLAFGHPFMDLGSIQMPLCTAWIHEIMPSIQRSSKMGAGMVDVGTVYRDSPWSIAGTMGNKPEMIPASFHIVDQSRGLERDYHVRVANQPMVTSALLSSALAAAVDATFTAGYEGTATIHYKIVGQKGDTVEKSNTVYFQQGAALQLMGEVGFPMYLLEENRFRAQNVASFEATAEFNERDDTAMIERVYAEEAVAKAGEQLTLHVILRPDGGEPVERVFKLDIPLETPKGSLRLAVAGGQLAYALRSRLQLLTPTFNDLDSFIEFYQDLEQNTDLVLIASLPTTGLMVGQTELLRLPGSIQNLITTSPRTDLYSGKSELSRTEKTPWVLYGVEYMAISTADRQGAKGAQPKPPSTKEGESAAALPEYLPPHALTPITTLWAADVFKEPVAAAMRAAAGRSGTTVSVEGAKPAEKAAPAKSDTADAEAEDTDADDGDDDDTDTEKSKLTARQVSRWTQTEAKEFLEGKLEGIAVQSDGTVTLAPRVERIKTLGEFYILSSTADDNGTVYLGTGSSGAVYAVGTDRTVEHFAQTDAFAVSALLADGAGGLLAAGLPGGVVYRIDAEGKTSRAWELPADYIWALGRGPGGRLLACTGTGGQVYELLEGGKNALFADFGQTHVLCMAAGKEHTYFGTASRGCVYRIGADGLSVALLDTGEQDIRALVVVGESADHPVEQVYAATAAAAEGGAVYRLGAEGDNVALYEDKGKSIHALAWLDGALYAGTGNEGELLRIADEKQNAVVYDADHAYMTCLQPVGEGRMIAGTTNMGSLLLVDACCATKGWLESSVLDAKRVAQWGALIWDAVTTGTGRARLLTRSGGNSDPSDETWSPWTAPLENGKPGDAGSPAARYLQYRLELERENPGDDANVHRVSVAYMPANRAPEVTIKSPKEGDVVSGTAKITWTAKDEDKDTLSTHIYCRRIEERAWQTVSEDPEATKDEAFDWKTVELKSGAYQLKLVVDDGASNPGAEQAATAVLELLVIDNEAPGLWVETTQTQGEQLVLTGVASDGYSSIAEVAYKLNGRWYAARPVDGMYDTRNERFEASMPIPKKKTTITVSAKDEAGNQKTVLITWPDGQTTEPVG